MSKDRNIDDAELANISGAGKEQDLAGTDGTGAPGDGLAQVPIGGGGGGGAPDGVEDQDQDGGEQTFGD